MCMFTLNLFLTYTPSHYRVWNRTSEMTYTTSWFQRLSPKTNYGVQFTSVVGDQVTSSAAVVGEYKVSLIFFFEIHRESKSTHLKPTINF